MTSRIFDKVQRWVKWALPFYLFTFLPLSLLSQTLTGSAPSHVAVGEQFRLTYTVNTQNVSDFRAGDIPDELEVLIGPNRSMQSSYQMINGHTSSSASITYTYIVSATKNGSYTISPAHVVVGGKTISSNPITIKVSGSASSARQQRQQRDDEGAELRDAGSRISGSDLFIKVSANKNRVHEQEPILLTYKVYTLVSLTQLRGDMPDLKSFYTQEVDLPQQKSFSVETVNGRPYRTCTWSQYVMFPQMTGKLQIPSITFEGIVVQQNRNVDPFEAFFNGGSGYIEVKKKIVAPSIDIQVDPLPQRPANFSGGVGKFTISAQLDKTETKANDPISMRIIISGSGNLKLMKQPVINVPKDFDKYEPKVTDKTKLTSSGIEGSMIYDVLIVPRHQGKYEIPPVELTYFDTSENAYKTIKSEAFTLDVAKGSGAASVSDDGKASAFYDEVLRALWGYVGDKLNIPVEQLSHDNISQKLSERSVDADTIALFIGALDECEFERYAPGDPKGNMNKVYDKAMTAISQIEGLMKHRRSAKASAVLLLLLMLPLGASAVTKAEADSAYVRGEYQQAITDYEALLKQGGSAELYYNLGNAYYRTENITKAVLNYERALLLSPGDRDIRFNLQIARSKTIDKIVPESEMFFITWYRALVNLMSVDAWARVALISLTLVIVLLLVYLFASRIWLRKVGFFGGILLLAVFVFSNLFAWQQKQNLLFRKGAIVVSPSVTVKSTPAKNGTDLFVLHEGTKVDITDASMRGWLGIRIADGKEGWVERKQLEEI